MSCDVALSPAPSATRVRSLMVTRQDHLTRRYERLGVLECSREGYTFHYDEDVASTGTRPLLGFSDLTRTYRSRHLFPLFDERVVDPRRPDRRQWLAWLGLESEDVHPMEFLARSGGRRRGDLIELIPLPEHDAAGRVIVECLVHGVRHVPGSEDVIRTLSPGDSLHLQPEPTNPVNSRALLVCRGRPFGYVPDPLLDTVHGLELPEATVMHVNGPEAGHNLRCLIRISGSRRAADSPGCRRQERADARERAT